MNMQSIVKPQRHRQVVTAVIITVLFVWLMVSLQSPRPAPVIYNEEAMRSVIKIDKTPPKYVAPNDPGCTKSETITLPEPTRRGETYRSSVTMYNWTDEVIEGRVSITEWNSQSGRPRHIDVIDIGTIQPNRSVTKPYSFESIDGSETTLELCAVFTSK